MTVFFQTTGSGDTDWPSEEEWRLKGNLVLRDMEKDDILILVPWERKKGAGSTVPLSSTITRGSILNLSYTA